MQLVCVLSFFLHRFFEKKGDSVIGYYICVIRLIETQIPGIKCNKFNEIFIKFTLKRAELQRT